MATGQRASVQLQLISGTGGNRSAKRTTTRKSKPAQARASRTWRLDAHTREIGREGVAQAKEILSRVTPPEPPGHRRAS
jgi:hypothetical protein